MEQSTLWYDRFGDALRAVVDACGGPKVIGHELWKSMDPTDASKKLARCLDEDRQEKLALHEIKYILKRGREVGCHLGTTFLLRECGYEDPRPLEPGNERQRLQREFITKFDELKQILGDVERLKYFDDSSKS